MGRGAPLTTGARRTPTAIRRWEAAARKAAGVGRCPIRTVPGNAAPVAVGEKAHATFKDGGECRSWYFAKRAGYRVKYHRSTLEVVVGEDWRP